MSSPETPETALSRLVHRFESGWERHQINDLRYTDFCKVKIG